MAGPGLLDVVAGRNLVQEDRASIVSVGPALRGDKRPGADIAITAGAGSAGPDYDALGKRYLTRPIAPWPARPDEPARQGGAYL